MSQAVYGMEHAPAGRGRAWRSARLRTNAVSWWYWMLTLMLIARLTVGNRRRAEFQDLDTMAGLQVAIVAVTAVAVLVSRSSPTLLASLWRPPLRWLTVLALLGIASALWSDLPTYSAYRAAEYGVQSLAILAACRHAHDILDLEAQVLAVATASIVLCAIQILQHYGLTLSLSAWHTNTYSACGAMVASYCAGELLSGRRSHRMRLRVMLCVGLVTVAVGTSTASNIAIACGLVAAAWLTRNIAQALFWCGALVVVLLLSGTDSVLGALLGGKSQEKLLSFGSRDILWEAALDRLWENPMLGSGYAVTSRTQLTVYQTNAHNSVVSVACGMGILGVLVMICALGQIATCLVRAVRARTTLAVGCTCALLTGVINSLSASYYGECWAVASLTLMAFVGVSWRALTNPCARHRMA